MQVSRSGTVRVRVCLEAVSLHLGVLAAGLLASPGQEGRPILKAEFVVAIE